MKKLVLAGLSLVLVFGLSACKCSAERAAADEVDRSHAIIATQLLKYVNADANIAGPKKSGESDADYEGRKKKARDDWKGLVESDKRNIDKLKLALEK